MALYGSTIPLDDGQYVVTTVCPNAYALNRMMQAMQNIVPEAADPLGAMPPNCDGHATFAPMPAFDPLASDGMCYSPDFGADEPALRANPLGRDEE